MTYIVVVSSLESFPARASSTRAVHSITATPIAVEADQMYPSSEGDIPCWSTRVSADDDSITAVDIAIVNWVATSSRMYGGVPVSGPPAASS